MLAAPALSPIGNVTVLGGAPLHVPLNAIDADGDALTYTVTSTNQALSLTIPEGNRSLRINVSHTAQAGNPNDQSFSGPMIFELFEDLAPRTTGRIIELAQQGFYDGVTFHRIAKLQDGTPFVIQGGDPTGTGSGGSGEIFDDEFHRDLRHTSAGILSMAKSTDDTNDSQFFVTAQATRFLDFNHSVFGFLTKGNDIRHKIQSVPVNSGERPLSPVFMESVEVFVDQQNAVLRINAPKNFVGTAEVMVTVSDGNGGVDTKTFQVTVQPDTNASRPFLSSYPNEIRMAPGATRNFTLEATDVDNKTVRFGLASNLPEGFSIDSGPIQVEPDANGIAPLQITLDAGTAAPGEYEIGFFVVDNNIPNDQVSAGNVDLQFIPVFVGTSGASSGTDTFALFEGGNSAFFFKNTNGPGPADGIVQFGPQNSGWTPLAGDWNGNGTDTFALFEPGNSVFFLKNVNGPGAADTLIPFGPPGGNWIPLSGDWDGDGTDTVALFEPNNSAFFFKNSNSPGPADGIVQFGPPGAGWIPLAGDWNGDGVDTFALFEPNNSAFFFKNSNSPGPADGIVQFGPPGAGWKPLAGDWNADGTDTFALFEPNNSAFFLKNANSAGPADAIIQFGPAGAGWVPLAGNWDGGSALSVAGGAVTPPGGAADLGQSTLDVIAEAAVARWAAAGIDAASLAQLANVQFRVADLDGAGLGLARGGVVYIDVNAAGHGWYIDAHPSTDAAFLPTESDNQLRAIAGSDAEDGIDLLTVVMHELGHQLGYADLDADQFPDELMTGILEAGVRRLPPVLVVDHLFADDLWA